MSKNGNINASLVRFLRQKTPDPNGKRDFITQRDIARAIGISFATYQAAETNGRVNLATLNKIAKFFRRHPADFLLDAAA